MRMPTLFPMPAPTARKPSRHSTDCAGQLPVGQGSVPVIDGRRVDMGAHGLGEYVDEDSGRCGVVATCEHVHVIRVVAQCTPTTTPGVGSVVGMVATVDTLVVDRQCRSRRWQMFTHAMRTVLLTHRPALSGSRHG